MTQMKKNERLYSAYDDDDEMFLGGCSDTTVQLFGRWDSDAYKAYVRIDRFRNMHIASRMMSMFQNSYHK